MEIVGTLRNARRVSASEDLRGPCLYGQVYGDTKGRFRDGDFITTSMIMSEDGNVFKTRYSAYRVEHWEGEPVGVTYGQAIEAMKRGGAAKRNVAGYIEIAHRGTPLQYLAYMDGAPFNPSVADQLAEDWQVAA